MDLIQKGQDDIVLFSFWDFVHKFNESHHQTNHTQNNRKPASKDGGYCPSAGAAHGLDGNADGLLKGSLLHTPGAVCGFCNKKKPYGTAVPKEEEPGEEQGAGACEEATA